MLHLAVDAGAAFVSRGGQLFFPPFFPSSACSTWPMSEDQKLAVLARDLNRCIALGGNIYFLAKIGATDGKSFQYMAATMTGMSQEEYMAMMLAGGRSAEGNRVLGEDGDAQPHRQPQGQAGQKQGA